jgi:hypothetical protein
VRLLLLVVLVAGCDRQTSDGPLAHIELDPAYIPEGDEYATPVLLDGRSSSDLVDASSSMTYAWSIVDADEGFRIDPSDAPPPGCGDHLRAPCVLVRFRGDHPVTIRLRIETDSGSDVDEATLGLTVD